MNPLCRASRRAKALGYGMRSPPARARADDVFKDHQPSATGCEARRRGRERMMCSKTMSPTASPASRMKCSTPPGSGAAVPLPPSPRWGEAPDSRPRRGQAGEGPGRDGPPSARARAARPRMVRAPVRRRASSHSSSMARRSGVSGSNSSSRSWGHPARKSRSWRCQKAKPPPTRRISKRSPASLRKAA